MGTSGLTSVDSPLPLANAPQQYTDGRPSTPRGSGVVPPPAAKRRKTETEVHVPFSLSKTNI
jgi:hypothetical protein